MDATNEPIRLRVEGMTCGSCVARVERALESVPGVRQARVNLTTETATIDLSGAGTPRAALIEAVRSAGYDADTFRQADGGSSGLERTHDARLREQRQALGQAVSLAVPIMVLHWLGHSLMSSEVGGGVWPVAIQALLCAMLLWSSAGAPILVGGLRALIHCSPNMDLLISLGVSVAFVAGVVSLFSEAVGEAHFHAAAMILAFINLGRYFEIRARRDATTAIAALVRRLPRTALRITAEGSVEEVPLERIEVGDRIRVSQDTLVPVDGGVSEGEAAVDESAVTGESVPKARRPGDAVIAGSIVRDGLLTIEATRVGADSTMGRIIRAVEEAQSGKTRMQRIADRVAGVFVPIVVFLALLTLVLSLWLIGGWGVALSRTVAVLVIACPCAMGLATPTAVLVATGSAGLRGILVRDAAALEATGRIDHVLLDKTGTLTTGVPEVTDVVGTDATNPSEVIRFAASVEQYSQHPLARAIVARAREQKLELDDPTTFSNRPGRGAEGEIDGRRVTVGSESFLADEAIDLTSLADRLRGLAASGKTVVLVAVDRECAGLIGLADTLRPGAADAVQRLVQQGMVTALVTGDHGATAAAVASSIGIDDVCAGMSPDDKLAEVKRRQQTGARVAFVGDGINDAPALAAADVGVTFASATDVAVGAADVTIVHDDLGRLVDLISLARRSVRIIKQNLFWAFFYNVIAIPLAAIGKIPPGYAAAAMMLSSISVVLNSLRLRKNFPIEPASGSERTIAS